ncbi:hypothetical protein ASG31_04355 [Chryseobacterium sp. Leaf404]|uniref:hypothetical protein n=1 Tax=unclassified Chryseobacterium TaxID=2593645 RepID=UPI0006F8E4F1|nr:MULTISPECIES: hypothetical protein [unclassified Chryseobacterium]KQT17975.1 hypothetical protein ASG31_04355 [Chryseobacterium sp. Leaf404]
MKKRIFRYRAVGIILFLTELFILLLFGEGTMISFEELKNSESLTWENINLPFAFATSLTALTCLIAICIKDKRSIKLFNIHYTIIAVFFVCGYLKQIFEGADPDEDIFKFTAVFAVLAILFLVVNLLKQKDVNFVDIEDIGSNA